MLLPLEDLLEQYAPNIVDCRGWDYLNFQRQVDGHIYWVDNYDVCTTQPLRIRTDWLAKLGMEVPTNVDELYDVLYAFVNNDPDGNGEKDTYGLYPTGVSRVIYPAFGANPTQWIWKDGTIVFGGAQEEVKAAVKYQQKLYQEGLLVADYPTYQSADMNALFSAGKCGAQEGFSFQYSDPNSTSASVYSPTGTETWTNISKLAGPGGEGGILSSSTPYIPTRYTALTEDCSDPELCMLYLNYLANEEAELFIIKGEEGKHFDFNQDGLAMVKDPYTDRNLLLAEGHSYTYVQPFQWKAYPPFNAVQWTLDLFDQMMIDAKAFYTAKPMTVPAIADMELDAGMNSYVNTTLTSLITGNDDVDTVIDEMIATLYKDYNLELQTKYVNEYAAEKGWTSHEAMYGVTSGYDR